MPARANTRTSEAGCFLTDVSKHEKKRKGIKHCRRGCCGSNRVCQEARMSFKETLLVSRFSRKKRRVYTTDKHPKQTLQSLEVSFTQDSKDTVLFLFSSEQQLFHLRQALEYARCHLQQLPAEHLPKSNYCFICAAVKHHMVPNGFYILTIYSFGASSSTVKAVSPLFPAVLHFHPCFQGLIILPQKKLPQAQF